MFLIRHVKQVDQMLISYSFKIKIIYELNYYNMTNL